MEGALILEKLKDHDVKFAEHDEQFVKIGKRFDAIDRRFDAMDQRFDAMDQRFDASDRRADSMQAQISDLQEEVHKLGIKQEAHEHKTDLILEIVQGLSEKLDTINAHTALLDNHEVRISALEHAYQIKS